VYKSFKKNYKIKKRKCRLLQPWAGQRGSLMIYVRWTGGLDKLSR